MLSNILSNILSTLHYRGNIDPLLGDILIALTARLDAASSTFWYYDSQKKLLELHLSCVGDKVHPAILPEAADTVPISFPVEKYRTTRRLLSEKQPFIQTISKDDPDLKDHGDWLISQGVIAVMQIPVLIEDSLVGWMPVHKAKEPLWVDGDIDLAKELAHQAAIAIQITRLHAQAKNSATLEERNRLARDIHDTLAQGFTGILIQLQAAEQFLETDPSRAQKHLETIRKLARDNLHEARRSVKNLLPLALDTLDLAEAIQDLGNNHSSGPIIKVELGTSIPRFLPEVATEIYRIVSEAVLNAVKHAEAEEVTVQVQGEVKSVTIKIEDNGKGISLRNVPHEGIGLQIMRERAEKIGATLDIRSRQGGGTTVEVKVAIAAEETAS